MGSYDTYLRAPAGYDGVLRPDGPDQTGGPQIINRDGTATAYALATGTPAFTATTLGDASSFASAVGNASLIVTATSTITARALAAGSATSTVTTTGQAACFAAASGTGTATGGQPVALLVLSTARSRPAGASTATRSAAVSFTAVSSERATVTVTPVGRVEQATGRAAVTRAEATSPAHIAGKEETWPTLTTAVTPPA